MASGCLMGTCPVCDELIWEDEWDIIDNSIIHAACRGGYIKNKLGMNEQQFLRLCGADELRREIRATKEDLARAKDYYMERLQLLEEKLDEIEKGEKGK